MTPGLSIVPSLSFWQYTGGLTSTTLLSLTVLLLVIQLKMSIFALLCNLVIFSYLYARPFFLKTGWQPPDFLTYCYILCPPPPFTKTTTPLSARPLRYSYYAPRPIPINSYGKKAHFKDKWRYLKTVLVTYKQKIITTQKKLLLLRKKNCFFAFYVLLTYDHQWYY